MAQIHSTAIVDRRAELADDVIIGAYSIIRDGVSIDEGTHIQEHCHIHGKITIGKKCQIGPAAYVGLAPQHIRYDGSSTRTIIGDECIIREMVSIHRSMYSDENRATRVGNRCMLMATSHIGHDCVIEDDVILANGALLGGHCFVGTKAFIGGGAAMHQFTRVGRLAIVAGNEAISHDVPPFAAVRYRGLKGYNAIGCKRSGMSREAIHAVRSAFHLLHVNRTLPTAVEMIRTTIPQLPEIKELLEFISGTKRGIIGSVRGKGISRMSRSGETIHDDDDHHQDNALA